MIKEEVSILLKEKVTQGYVTYSTLLELYQDGELIPEDMVNLMYHEVKPKPILFRCGEKVANIMNRNLGISN